MCGYFFFALRGWFYPDFHTESLFIRTFVSKNPKNTFFLNLSKWFWAFVKLFFFPQSKKAKRNFWRKYYWIRILYSILSCRLWIAFQKFQPPTPPKLLLNLAILAWPPRPISQLKRWLQNLPIFPACGAQIWLVLRN